MEGKSKFAEHIIQKRPETRNIENIMVIIKPENSHTKIDILEEIKMIRAAKSADILNDINGKNEPLYILLQSEGIL